ncbi:MAG: AraC family transcriptional regulator [Lachnospiraceae bacterium]|nr:AraC family transcriptional regulator [Lachnospiraceae bacterium]
MRQDLQEKRKQGTPMHPLKIYRMQDVCGKIDVPYHWQETVEILWIQQGQLSLMIQDVPYTGAAGNLFYVNPCELHGMQSLTQDCIYLAFVFPLSWLQFDQADEAGEKYLKPLEKRSASIAACLPERTAACLIPVFREIYSLYESGGEGAWLGIKANLLYFYYFVYKSGLVSFRQEASGQMDMRLKISRYIQEHSSEPLSLEKLGSQFHMSPKYFSLYFQKYFSRSFSDYLMATRVEKAKKLLIETDADMELIAQQAGFSSSSYFIRVFREALGMTPGKYRKEFLV